MPDQDDQRLNDSFLPQGSHEINDILQVTMALARSLIAGTDASSITVRRDEKLFTATYDDPIALSIDEVQYHSGQGPCVTAVTDLGQHYVPSVTRESRWPSFLVAARTHGVNSSMATPMVFDENAAGAINLYSRSDGAFGEDELRAAKLFADYAAGFLSTTLNYVKAQDLNEQLYEAILSREIIGEAKGILMAAENIGPQDAFLMLRKISMDTNTPLREIARRLVESRQTR